MPLVDNECFLLNKEEFTNLHKFYVDDEQTITIGSLAEENTQKIRLSINSIFASHIGIFGNTGSGKSNTLAKIFHELFSTLKDNNNFTNNSKFLLIDFNGEYSGENTICDNKQIVKINTRIKNGKDKIRIREKDFLDIELISILSNATEKTQQPFIKRVIKLYKDTIKNKDDGGKDDGGKDDGGENYFRNQLERKLKDTLLINGNNNISLASNLLDLFKEIVNKDNKDNKDVYKYHISWHGSKEQQKFILKNNNNDDKVYIDNEQTLEKEYSNKINIVKYIENYKFSNNIIEKFLETVT